MLSRLSLLQPLKPVVFIPMGIGCELLVVSAQLGSMATCVNISMIHAICICVLQVRIVLVA